MQQFTKIILFFLIILLGSCNVYRKIPKGKLLLKKNVILVDSTETNKDSINSLLWQSPNTMIFGYPIRADIYAFADQHPNTTYYKWIKKHDLAYKFLLGAFSRKQIVQLQRYYKDINQTIEGIGEPPVYIDTTRINKSAKSLKYYFINHAYLDANLKYKIDTINKHKGSVVFDISKQDSYFIRQFSQHIKSPYLAKIYNQNKDASHIKTGNNYLRDNFVKEKERLTKLFRDKGVYHFQPSYVNFDLVFDTIHRQRNLMAHLNIMNRTITKGDSVYTEPFVPYRIGKVNIYLSKNKDFDKTSIKDSTQYQQVHIYTVNDRLRYRSKLLTGSIFIKKGQLYSDQNRLRTHRLLMSLQNFKQSYIQYVENKVDTTLTTNIYLITQKRFFFKNSIDITHSNIHDFGVKGALSLNAKNIFRGGEILSASTSLMTASSNSVVDQTSKLFNVSEFGTNLTLTFPRLLLPFHLNKHIPKYMLPKTHLTFLSSTQTNIGLDRSKYAGIFGFEWEPKKERKFKVDLFNLEFITNNKANNYFKIYTLSYNNLENIAQNLGESISPLTADDYIDSHLNNLSFCAANPSVCSDLKNIREREQRITQNIFIISNRFDMYYDSRKKPLQTDFYMFNSFFELSGSILSPFARLFNMPTNDIGQYTINKVPYAEYAKLDLSYIRHWQIHRQHILAYRVFLGFALPYGNSKSVPFVSSYFAGGSNDIRAWRAYTLGPGTSGGPNEFNEANFKFSTNLEYRFPIAGYFKGALFTDIGNIWNIKNDQTDEKSTFKGFSSLQDVAIGSGLGLRVDFTYFIIRFDLAFKTYDPSKDNRWLVKDWSIQNSVLNLGISYPF